MLYIPLYRYSHMETGSWLNPPEILGKNYTPLKVKEECVKLTISASKNKDSEIIILAM